MTYYSNNRSNHFAHPAGKGASMIASEPAVARKARGAFYTPHEIADHLAEWAIRPGTTRILEPSAGDGVFLEAAASRLVELHLQADLVGVELVQSEADVARTRTVEHGVEPTMVVGDFFDVDAAGLGRFDAVIGNPPWIRYHGFTGDQRARARARSAEMGVELTGLSSSWAPYLVHSTSFLTEGGRIAMVLPGELLQVDYAAGLRRFLASRFRSVRLVAFDHHVFGDAEVDAILLLASQDEPPGVSFERVSSMDEIGAGTTLSLGNADRWASAVASSEALDVMRELESSGRYVRLGALGSVDIGVVTGFNDYFVVSQAEADGFELDRAHLRPIVTRSDQLVDGVVTDDHLARWQAMGRKVWLLTLSRREPNGAGRYLAEGIRMGVQSRYKCRTRSPWYAVPLKLPPDLFLSYMAQVAPRLAWNEARALSTNLIHGVYLHEPDRAPQIATSWANVATALSAELEGRMYGGGVLKLETKEAERILVPNPERKVELSDGEVRILSDAVDARRTSRTRGRRPTPRSAWVGRP